ncbi:MAG: NRDE family protein [Myxococcales bacterium]|nr:NRDE family protein [Myxococcales bacterium]MCB9628535.1 NRDE family protein [Sandaracinaceae bacterium]
MCTLIAFHRIHEASEGTSSGTLVAANRDEFYARPARAPELIAPHVVAGVDVSQGGTWLGVHASGLFVGLTNQRSFGGRDATKKTRGEVVLRALGAAELEPALATLRELDAREYNGFNLLLGDGDRLVVAYARPESPDVELQELGAGVHVLGNDRLRSPDFPKAARIEREAQQLVRAGAAPFTSQVEPLRALLANHAQPELDSVHVPPGAPFPRELVRALEATCIHTPHYGTVSSTLLELTPGHVAQYWHAAGAPCQAPLRPVPLATLLLAGG